MYHRSSDKVTREVEKKVRVYGALLAQQSGRDIDIVNSFELPIPQQDKIDKQYLATKQEQCKLLIDESTSSAGCFNVKMMGGPYSETSIS